VQNANTYITQNVIENAKLGNPSFSFTILCIQNRHLIPDFYTKEQIEKQCKQFRKENREKYNEEIYKLYNIQKEKVISLILETINATFPDSKIREVGYQKCCPLYEIAW
jgi:hypothetical protein